MHQNDQNPDSIVIKNNVAVKAPRARKKMHTFPKNIKVCVPLTDEQRITEVLGDNITEPPPHLFAQQRFRN